MTREAANAASPAATSRPRLADRVVLISLDAFRPEFCRDETWPAPVLQQLAWEGAYADGVRSVFPALTYPAHATIVTGALPARHGIFHNRPFEPGGQTGRWHWESAAFRVPTLWESVHAAGGTTASVGWPTTVGAAIDWNVPDIWQPEDPAASLRAIRARTAPAGLFEELEHEATGRLGADEFRLGSLPREDRMGDIAAYLLRRYRPTLLLLHIVGTDHLQHEFGRANPKTRRAVAASDRAIGKILDAAEQIGVRERTTFIVTGDHGTIDSHTAFRPNVLLAEAGLQADRSDRGDWRATFFASGGSAFLRLRDPRDLDALSTVRGLLEKIRPGERRLFRIVERVELDELGADPEASMALVAEPGIVFTEEPWGSLIQPASGAGHGYHPALEQMKTGFVASGAGIRRGATAPLLPLENVAPLVAALLGIAFRAPDGTLFPGLLESRIAESEGATTGGPP